MTYGARTCSAVPPVNTPPGVGSQVQPL
ncbi:hypothetical protein RDI58_030278 [Solanum bulbocastanum]|uniref:Uncharacterized protein n=1 Tax=Solanum bulbocastanum TaxID=147425 RepID=A0AAN8SV03_SOLBU